jgi:hypothetical protein
MCSLFLAPGLLTHACLALAASVTANSQQAGNCQPSWLSTFGGMPGVNRMERPGPGLEMGWTPATSFSP